MRIGELAEVTGVAAKTIRYYEDEGLMPPAERAANGYRTYGEQAARRLRFIRNARALDIPVADLREVLAARDRGEAPCVHVRALMEEKIVAIEERIRQLHDLRAELDLLLAAAETLPEDTEMERCVCGLIRSRGTRH